MKLNYKVEKNNKQITLYEILKEKINMSSSLMKRINRNGSILVNNERVRLNSIVQENSMVEISLPSEKNDPNVIIPNNLNITTLYEDDSFIALDKPPGILVNPINTDKTNTLSNHLMFDQITNNKEYLIRAISRLDRGTSGIVLFAKNSYVQNQLISRKIKLEFIKKYTAIVNGIPTNSSGEINLPIQRKSGSIIEREIGEMGKASITKYTVVKEINNYAILDLELETGRTHQIRVHLNAIAYPIIGDTLYGTSSLYINRQALHAHKVSFIHPINKKKIIIESALPKDITFLIENL